jgi:hypothetical protein
MSSSWRLPLVAASVLVASSLVAAACGGDDAPATDAAVITLFDAPPPADAAPGHDSATFGEVCPVTGYEACGGELEGTWYFAASCPENATDIPCESPFDNEPVCTSAGNTVTCATLTSGEMTFTGTEVHVLRSFSLQPTYVFTGPCLATVLPKEPDTAARCASLTNDVLSCTVTGESCTCVGQSSAETIDDTAPFTVDGNNISLDTELTATYCVADGKLTLDFDPHPQSWRYWVLER